MKRILLMLCIVLMGVGNAFAEETVVVSINVTKDPIHDDKSPIIKDNISFGLDEYYSTSIPSYKEYKHYVLFYPRLSSRPDLIPDKTTTISVADVSTGCKIKRIEFKSNLARYYDVWELNHIFDGWDEWKPVELISGELFCTGQTSNNFVKDRIGQTYRHVVEFASGVTSTTLSIKMYEKDGYVNVTCDEIIVYCEYPDHTHSYDSEWFWDEGSHWHQCTSNYGLCDQKQEYPEAHVYGELGADYYTCKVCGYVNDDRKHVHDYSSSWSYSKTHHWHACTGMKGMCEAPTKDSDVHEFGSSFTDAAANYTCTTCGYVDEDLKEQYDDIDFLSFTAVGGDMSIGLQKLNNAPAYTLRYSLDRLHWTILDITATTDLVTIPAGQTCYFSHGTAEAADHVSNGSGRWQFTMTGDGTIEAGGNVMTLLDASGAKNELTTDWHTQHAFSSLFQDCAKLTVAPQLSATVLGQYCYNNMFEGTAIREIPALPAVSVPDGAYIAMFKNCKNLEAPAVLGATALSRAAYSEMFNGCEKLTQVTLGEISSATDANRFNNWLAGTAVGTEGLLIAPDALVGNANLMLPENWTFKQIRDYVAAVEEVAAIVASQHIKSVADDYITRIKAATSNSQAVSLRDEALQKIAGLVESYNVFKDEIYAAPTAPGIRMKVTKKDGKIYEFDTREVQSVDYIEVTE